jgi:hypothetical protein
MRFLERRQLLEQRRVGNRHTQHAPTKALNPGLTTPRLADRVGPGRLQLPQSLDSCQAPRGEQIGQDVRQGLRSPGIRARTRSGKPARGPSPVQRPPGTPSLAVIGPATQDERPFIITTRLGFGNRQRPVIRPVSRRGPGSKDGPQRRTLRGQRPSVPGRSQPAVYAPQRSRVSGMTT